MKKIPYGKQILDDSDIRAVLGILTKDWITQGPEISRFENALARYCGVKYAVAVSSGTAALHLACLAAGLKKGDEAITSPITFLATANAIIYAGAKPVFADICYDSVNIDPEKIKQKVTKRTKAVLPVHFAGLPCDMEKISSVARKSGLIVIEDASHALGAAYRQGGRWVKIGSCRHSDMTVFSFHPVKAITTGEGGAITTNSKRLYKKLKCLRNHGICKTPEMERRQGLWYYEMRDLGFNYRITDFQCALGSSQIKKLDEFIARRNVIAETYSKAFEGLKNVVLPLADDGKKHAYHLYVLKIDFMKLKTTRKEFMAQLKRQGILTQVHYIPLYRQPFYKKNIKVLSTAFPQSEDYYRKAISIPIYPGMRSYEIKKTIGAVKGILNEKEEKE